MVQTALLAVTGLRPLGQLSVNFNYYTWNDHVLQAVYSPMFAHDSDELANFVANWFVKIANEPCFQEVYEDKVAPC